MSDTNVYFCPQCGSAAVDYTALAGTSMPASCRGCKWQGPVSDLLAVPMRNDLSSELLIGLVNDMRGLLSGELGIPYLKFLLKWGFLKADVAKLNETLDRKQFARYLSVIAQSITTALIEERERQEAKGTDDAKH